MHKEGANQVRFAPLFYVTIRKIRNFVSDENIKLKPFSIYVTLRKIIIFGLDKKL